MRHLAKTWDKRTSLENLTLTIRRLIVPLTLAIVTAYAGQANAQGAFPAPLPGRQTIQPNDPAFPPVNGAAPTVSLGAPPPAASPFPSGGAAPVTGTQFERPPSAAPQAGGAQDACMKAFVPLREEAEKRGKLIKAASDRHAPPAEACKLISNFGQAELKMIKYIETHSTKCGIPPQISEQMKNGHKNTENLLKKVCAVAQ